MEPGESRVQYFSFETMNERMNTAMALVLTKKLWEYYTLEESTFTKCFRHRLENRYFLSNLCNFLILP